MKIAQIIKSLWKVDPHSIDASHLIVSQITEELIRRGHDVTLFASGDSKTKAKLFSVIPRCINYDRTKEPVLNSDYDYLLISELIRQADKFDIIHSHFHIQTGFFSRFINTPIVSTLHDPLDRSLQKDILSHLKNSQYYISISNDQRKPMPQLNYVGTVYHGTDINKLCFNPNPEDHLVYFGRIDAAKGTKLAIESALKAKKKLMIGGVVHRQEQWKNYWFDEIVPFIKDKKIVYYGEINSSKKSDFLGKAKALLFTTHKWSNLISGSSNPKAWREPFGLTAIEAMACGTPVIAFKWASMPEIIVDGKTGFLVDSVGEMVEAIKNIDQIDRRECRKHVEKNFTIKRMVDKYERIYQKVLKIHQKKLKK